jgi:hypothetical protein
MRATAVSPGTVRTSVTWSNGSSLYVGALALVLWVVAVSRAPFTQLGAVGLISILGPLFFVGFALATGAFVYELYRERSSEGRMVVLALVLVVFMFGTACAIEPIASRGDSWLHVGYIQYIYQHGHSLNGYDARFSWPGGFSLGAVLVAFTGQANALAFIRWFPLFIEMLYLAPVYVIARSSGVTRKTGWLGVALFFSANWIYQDYFSPQALNYLFFLVVIATVLWGLSPRQRVPTVWLEGPVRRLVVRAHDRFMLVRPVATSVSHQSPVTTMSLLGLSALVILASVMSHQLTPYALILALTACLFTRRLGWPELIVLAAMLAVGWLSLGAVDFWVGHLSTIFGSIGKVGSTINSNVTARVTGSSAHRLVVDVRILITAGVFGLAAIGALLRRPATRTLEALAGVPFLLLGLQSYGGEGLLRVVLFGLPFVSLLAASALTGHMPRRRAKPRASAGSAALRVAFVWVVLTGVAGATLAVRGGNDAYEAFSLGELSAVNYVYGHIPNNGTIGLVAPFLPIGQQDVNHVTYLIASTLGGPPTVAFDARALIAARPAYVILSASQDAWGRIVQGYPVGWESVLFSQLIRGGFTVARSWADATVLKGPVIGQ